MFLDFVEGDVLEFVEGGFCLCLSWSNVAVRRSYKRHLALITINDSFLVVEIANNLTLVCVKLC